MLDVSSLLNEVGAKIVADLKNDIRNKTITKYGAVNASGRLEKSIVYKVEGTRLIVTGESYIYFLEAGRRNGKRPPKQAIREWIESKPSAQANFGWNQLKEYQKNSIVYLIQRKIGEKGTTIFQQGGSDLVSAVINKDIIDFIQAKLLEGFNTETVQSFRSQVVRIAA